MELHTVPTHSRRVTVHATPTETPVFTPFLLAALAAPATSTELQPGMIYEPGQAVNVSALGLTLTLPPDHRGTLPHGSEWFVIESSSGSRMLVYADRVSEQDMIQALSAPIALPGAMLMPRTYRSRFPCRTRRNRRKGPPRGSAIIRLPQCDRA